MPEFDTNLQFSVSAQNLCCQRDDHPVFSNLNFNVKSGEALFLHGQNGSGKSTLLLAISGLLPFEGDLSFGRTKIQEEQTPIGHHIHFISTLNAMKSELTLAENLRFWCLTLGGQTRSIPQALEKAGLGGLDNFLAGHLSTGQKHRLSLARLLAIDRPIWLLDEPSSALDSAGDEWVAALIDEHLAKKGLVITATHRPINLNNKSTAKTLNLGSKP